MSNLDIKVNMLEALYDLAENGHMDNFQKLRKYAIAIRDDMPLLYERLAYKNAIDKISLAMETFEVDDISYAKKSIETYKDVMKYFNNRKSVEQIMNGG